MKTWSIASVACLLLANSQFISYADAVEGEDPPGFRSPQCTQGLTKRQDALLKHFNGVFGSFTVDLEGNNDLVNPSMYGPIAALDIKADGYGFNMNSHDIQCNSPDRLLRVGLMAKQADVKGDVHGSVVAESGNVEATGQSETCLKQSSFSGVDFIEDMSDSLFAFAPSTLRKTSEKLSQFTPDTLIDRKSFTLTSSDSNRSFKGYRIVKFPACSDSDCVSAIPRKETSISVLKAGSAAQSQYQEVPSDEMIVFNIPVYVGNTFTITTANVNRNISPCQIIYNFFPADKRGNYVSDPNATFTLVRSPGVTIAGTILAPQANIIDSETGYFGGQLLTLQSYQGKGADIKDFLAVSSGQCSSRSLCLPAEHIPKVVTEVVTATAISTKTVGQDENQPAVHVATVTVKEAKVVTAVERVPVVTVNSVKIVTALQEENQLAAANDGVKVVTAVETVQTGAVKFVTAFAEEQPAAIAQGVKVVTATKTVQAEQVTATVQAVKTVTASSNEDPSHQLAKRNRVLAKREAVVDENEDLEGVKVVTVVETVQANGVKTVTAIEEDAPTATVQDVKVVTAVETLQADGVKVVTAYAEEQPKNVKIVTAVETVQATGIKTVTAVKEEQAAGVMVVNAVETVQANGVKTVTAVEEDAPTATVQDVKVVISVETLQADGVKVVTAYAEEQPKNVMVVNAVETVQVPGIKTVTAVEGEQTDGIKVVTAVKTVKAAAVTTVTAMAEEQPAANGVKVVTAVKTVHADPVTATVDAVKTVTAAPEKPARFALFGAARFIRRFYKRDVVEEEDDQPVATVKGVKIVTAVETVPAAVATVNAVKTVTAVNEHRPAATVQGVKVVTAVETVQENGVKTVTAIEEELAAANGVKVITAVETVAAATTATVNAVKTVVVEDEQASPVYKGDTIEGDEQEENVVHVKGIKIVTAFETVEADVKTVTAVKEDPAATVQGVKTVVVVETVQAEQAIATVQAVETVYADEAPVIVTVKGIKTVYGALENEQENPRVVVQAIETVTAAVTVNEKVATATVTAVETVIAEQD